MAKGLFWYLKVIAELPCNLSLSWVWAGKTIGTDWLIVTPS